MGQWDERLLRQFRQQSHQPGTALQGHTQLGRRLTPQMVGQRAQEGCVRFLTAPAVAATFQHRPACLRRAFGSLSKQAGFANARLPRQQEQGWSHAFQVLVQLNQLVYSPHEWGHVGSEGGVQNTRRLAGGWVERDGIEGGAFSRRERESFGQGGDGGWSRQANVAFKQADIG